MTEAITKKEIYEYALEYVSEEESKRYAYYETMYGNKGVRQSAYKNWREWYHKKITLESMIEEMR